MMRSIGLDRSDLRFWGLTFGPLLALVAALYTAAFLLAPAHHRFGGFLLDTADSYSYLSWSRAFAEQGPLVDSPTSLTPQPGAYFNLVWYLFGRAVQLTGIPFLVLYYAFGIVSGGAMYLLLLAVMKALISDRLLARGAYLAAGFGTGLGWLVFLLSRDMVGARLVTADIANGDGFPVYTFWTFPHVSFSWCLLLVAVLLLLRGAEGFRPLRAIALLALAAVTGFSHPYQVLVVLPVFALWYLLLGLKRAPLLHARWGNLLCYAAGAAPAMRFFYRLANEVPGFAFLAEFPQRTVILPAVVLGYAPFLTPALLGFRGLTPLAAFTDRYLLMACWAVLGFFLQHAWPIFHNEGRLNQGWLIPLSVLGAWGLGSVVLPRVLGPDAPDPGPDMFVAPKERLSAGDRRPGAWKPAALAAAAALALLPTTGLVMTHQVRELNEGDAVWFNFTNDQKLVVHEDELQALAWMDRELKGRPLVMSGARSGAILAALAPVRVFWGHPANPPDVREREAAAVRFLLASATPEARREFLRKYPVDWLYWGPDEFASYGKPPLDTEILELVYGKGLTGIFRVRRERLASR